MHSCAFNGCPYYNAIIYIAFYKHFINISNVILNHVVSKDSPRTVYRINWIAV